MCFTLFATGMAWVGDKFKKLENRGAIVFADPFVFLSGGIAGAAGRAAAISFDKGGPKGPVQAVYRRIPQFGVLMWIYVPLSSKISVDIDEPGHKMFSTFFIGFLAGLVMRVICNPVNRVRDEAMRTGDSFLVTAQALRKKTYLQFYYTTPNILVNAFYCGVLMVCFEGIRRFMERNGASTDNYFSVVATNTVAGGAAAAVASTVCYPYSAHRYLQTVIHDSAICRGLPATLLKEVPMMAVSFGAFSALQPLFAPHHGKRVGFGY
jgi:hypothetical protein